VDAVSEPEPDLSVVRASGPEQTVSMLVMRVTVAALERAGVARDRLLAAVGMSEAQLDASAARLPLSEVERICDVALELSGDAAFGLHWAEQLSVDTFSPTGYLVAHAASLGDGLASLAQFARLVSDDPHFVVEQDAHEVRLRCRLHDRQSPGLQRLVAELAVASFIRIVQCFVPSFRPERVCFEYPAPAYRHEYTKLFSGAERFDQAYTGIAFDRQLLAAKPSYRDEGVHEALTELAARRVSQLDQRERYAARVRDLLVARGQVGGPAMVDIAAKLELSVHALRRRLTAEATSFDAIVHEAFAILVRELLLDRQCSIQEAAYQLGFSGTATFHRAFKRAMGTTPGAYLETQLGPRRS
jgi:AraC-like DNA-binding protein